MKSRAEKPVVRSLTLQPDLAEVGRARQFLREIGESSGFSEERLFDLTVACSEALANAIEHSAARGQTRLETLLYSDRLEVQVEGPGTFHPPSSGRDRSHRGLGLPLMAYLSDHLALYSGPRGGTLVSLTFYKGGASQQDKETVLPPTLLELIEENELTSAIVNTVPLGICVLDPELRFRWANNALLGFLQGVLPGPDIAGVSVADIILETATQPVMERLKAVSRTGVADRWNEEELRSAASDPAWWRGSALPLFGENNEPPFDVLLVVSDETERKKYELDRERLARQVEEKAAELQALLDLSPVGIWTAHDDRCDFVTGNLRAERYSGAEVERGQNLSFSAPGAADRIPYTTWRDGTPLSADRLPCQTACATAKPVVDEQLEFRYPDGRVLSLIVNSVPLFDGAGKVRGAVTIGADVTVLKEREAQLKESNEHLRIVSEFVSDWEDWVGPGGDFLYLSPSVEQLTGFPREEFFADPRLYYRIVHPDDWGRVGSSLSAREVISDGLLYRIIRADGNVRWIEQTARSVHGPDGEYLGNRRSHRDVTNRVEAESALRQSEQYFRGLAEAVPQIVWTADAQGRVEWFNQQWCTYTGKSQAEGEGWGWFDVVHPEDRERAAKRWQESPLRRDTYQNEIRLRRQDGEFRWFLVRAWPLHDDQDSVTRWFGTQTDVHEMKQAEEALMASNQELQRFNRAAVDRELRMVELKREVNELYIAAGKPPKYALFSESQG